MRKYLCLSYLLAIPAVLMQARLHWTLRQDRQQPAGEEGPCPEPTGAGRVGAAAPAYRAAAVP